jgi:spermidine/putrescine transport system permease protein
MAAAEAEALLERAPEPPAPDEHARRFKFTPYFLLIPGLAWLAIFFVWPMFSLLKTSLQEQDLAGNYIFTWHWETYKDAFTLYHTQFIRSFVYAGIATASALAISFPLAYTIAFKSGRWKNLLLVLVIAPFFTSFLIRTLAWQTILSDSGIVSRIFNDLGLFHVLKALHLVQSDQLLNTPFAVISGLTYNFLPFMTLPLYASLEKIDLRLLEAGADLYASAWTTFRKITWPLSLPGVVAGTLLTFIPAAGDYINSKLLGNVNTTMIGQVIDGQFLRVLDYPTASALSFSLMLTILVIVIIYIRRAGTEDLV